MERGKSSGRSDDNIDSLRKRQVLNQKSSGSGNTSKRSRMSSTFYSRFQSPYSSLQCYSDLCKKRKLQLQSGSRSAMSNSVISTHLLSQSQINLKYMYTLQSFAIGCLDLLCENLFIFQLYSVQAALPFCTEIF